MKHIILSVLLITATGLFGQNMKDTRAWDSLQTYKPIRTKGSILGEIPPVRDLEPQKTPPGPVPKKLWRKRNYFFPNALNNPNPLPHDRDPLQESSNPVGDRNGGPELNMLLNFEGLHDPSGVTPPDPVGDIGKDHYVQMVNSAGNSWFQVWNKQGQTVYGPALSSTIWSQVNSGSIGDPIIKYDPAAQRWIMMELRSINANELLLAISNTSDPTGGWKAYSFPTMGFPDYPKLYIWPDAYYITVNELSGGNKCAGYALERNAILAGAPDFQVYRFEMPNYLAIQYQPATGANWEGGTPPPAGAPGYIFRVYDDAWDGGMDQLQVWQIHVNWQDINQSNISGPSQLFPAPFETKVCFSGLFNCIEQPDSTAPHITALENIIMFKAAYRNFGDHESVVLNHVADVSGVVGPGGDAAVRWYELRKTASTPWTIYQQGTYAPDIPTNRFMGNLSFDDQGNIALGYSVCSSKTVYPGLRLTGRRTGDPLGQMPIQEYKLVDGAKSHQDERWGDYSAMTVDPTDGRTFWFVGEYQPADDIWGTRIASFKVKRDTYDVTPVVLKAPVASNTLGTAEHVTVSVLNSGIADATTISISMYFEGGLVGTSNIPNTFAPGAAVDFTFPQTVNMNQVGKVYQFMFITHWGADSFAKNDTLRAAIRHLTSNDAASGGRANFPGQICGSDYKLDFVLRNASAANLQSAVIHWKINNQAYQTYQWTGNLAAGARDTVPLALTGISNGVNFFYAYTTQPNGQPDQDISNDTLFFKFFGNLSGTYLTATTATDYGILKMELRNFNNQALITREFPEHGPVTYQLCTDDNTCYKLVLKSSTLAWQGHFTLLDIFGNVLVQAGNASPDGELYDFCTPTRNQVDVGALALAAPVSGPSLTAAEPVRVTVRNFGLAAQSNIEVAYRFENGNWHTGTLPGILQPAESADYTFPGTENLSASGAVYNFEIRATVAGDQAPGNDARKVKVYHRPQRDLSILSMVPDLLCGDTTGAELKLTLFNAGLTDIAKAQYVLKVNGITQAAQDLQVPIPVGDTIEYMLNPTGLVFGNNTVSIEITDVEGLGKDNVGSNDTASVAAPITPGGFGVVLSILTDTKPGETRWKIIDSHGVVVGSGGPYAKPNNSYFAGICLHPDSCYQFLLLDSGHDGMNGFVQLESYASGIITTFYGGNFGDTLSTPFCATSICAGFSLKSVVTPPSGPNTADGKIQVHVKGGAKPYTFILNGVKLQTDSLFTGLLPGTYTITCVDANQCESKLIVTITVTATNDPMADRAFKVSPNPTTGLLWMEIPAGPDEQNATCYTYDMQGRLVMAVKMSRWDDTLRGVIALDTYPAGTYIFKLKSLGHVFTAKAIKH
jgi:hypothetical protein